MAAIYVLIGDYSQGGYRMPDVIAQIKALKISWLIRALEAEGDWEKEFIENILMKDLIYFMRSPIKFCDIQKENHSGQKS